MTEQQVKKIIGKEYWDDFLTWVENEEWTLDIVETFCKYFGRQYEL